MEDFNSKYTGQQVEDLLDQVASGNAGGGGGGIAEVYVADFTIESLRAGIYNGTNVDCDVQALVDAMNANKVILVREDEDSSVRGVHVLNGYAEDLLYFSIVDTFGNILWCEGTDYLTLQYIDAQTLHERSWGYKQDTLKSGENIKTINGESILGSGNITISGGSGEQGPQGPQGDKGDTGVGVQSVTQTTTSDADGGSNVVTVTLTDGTKSTFTVKNGSKGSQGEQGIQGIQGEQGPKGDTGATGAQGPKGDKGDKGDTGAAGANGTNGVSVSSVKQTTTSSADGGTNVVTVTLSNGTTSTFNVKNGSKGSNGTNGTNGKDGADGATFTPSVDSAGNLSWTNNKGLTNPPTVNIKGPKGDAGEGGGSSGGGKEVIVDNSMDVQINNALPNKIYILNNFEISTIQITSFAEETDYDEYTFIFQYPLGELSLPSDVVFANETTPIVGASTVSELSIVGFTLSGQRRYNAVLTTFGYIW